MTNHHSFHITEPLLKVDQLSVTYDLPIIKDVNIEIDHIVRDDGTKQGRKIAIVAPSGTGKTTLFRRIAGLDPPSSGRVLIGVEQKPVHAGMVGVVPQNYLLFNHRTVEQTLMIAAGMREKDKTKVKTRVLEKLQQFGLEDRRHAYPPELSGGQKQRVSIAEQLLSSNHFLLMDEPFSGLDVITKKKVCQVIDQVSAADDLNTIILTTHDLESAVMIADTILLLGRDRDQHNNPIPGAHIVQTIDLIDRDLAWHEDVEHAPGFVETVQEIKQDFERL